MNEQLEIKMLKQCGFFWIEFDGGSKTFLACNDKNFEMLLDENGDYASAEEQSWLENASEAEIIARYPDIKYLRG